jgi:hypothetical protein
MAKEVTAADYEEIVKGPGKFEGENRYIPYYYMLAMDGQNYEDDEGNMLFDVTAADRALFPELEKVVTVKLYEREDGFVVEVK